MGNELMLTSAQKAPITASKASIMVTFRMKKPANNPANMPPNPTKIVRLRPNQVAMKPLGMAKRMSIAANAVSICAPVPGSTPSTLRA